MQTIFVLLEVKGERSFSQKLNTREDLIKEILKFCPRSFKYRDMMSLIAVEDEDGEDTDMNVDKHMIIAENIKKHVERIMSDNDADETYDDDENDEKEKDNMSNEK